MFPARNEKPNLNQVDSLRTEFPAHQVPQNEYKASYSIIGGQGNFRTKQTPH